MTIKHFLPIIILLAIVSSCKKNEQETVDMGYNYFPLKTNAFSIYKVDSIVWDDYSSTIDTFHYEVKLVIDSQYYDNENRKSFRWKKYIKTDSSSWAFNTNYSLTITKDRLESVKENIRYIKLIFPVEAGRNWDYNSLNIDDAAQAQYSDVDYSISVLNKQYDSCATVTYENEIDLIQEMFYEVKYAKNIGIISSIHTHKKKLTTGLQGYSVSYQLMEYGN